MKWSVKLLKLVHGPRIGDAPLIISHHYPGSSHGPAPRYANLVREPSATCDLIINQNSELRAAIGLQQSSSVSNMYITTMNSMSRYVA